MLMTAAGLGPGQLQLLRSMADALGADLKQWRSPDSDLVTDGFADYFGNRLLLHHAVSDEKFKKKTFEYALVAAARHDGRSADLSGHATVAGADVRLDAGERWSLKTEASASINPTMVTISKFSEARWIRDCRTRQDFHREALRRVGAHLEEYDRVAILRGRDVSGAVRYDLLEIPIELLRRLSTLLPDDFGERKQDSGSSAADVLDVDGSRAYRLALDGSVEKVTVRSLPINKCIHHGYWEIPDGLGAL